MLNAPVGSVAFPSFRCRCRTHNRNRQRGKRRDSFIVQKDVLSRQSTRAISPQVSSMASLDTPLSLLHRLVGDEPEEA